jgi:hypothetical protein
MDHDATPPPPDRPLPPGDPFLAELRLFLAPRVNPADGPGPPSNPAVDLRAVERVARMLRTIVG